MTRTLSKVPKYIRAEFEEMEKRGQQQDFAEHIVY